MKYLVILVLGLGIGYLVFHRDPPPPAPLVVYVTPTPKPEATPLPPGYWMHDARRKTQLDRAPYNEHSSGANYINGGAQHF